MSERMLERDPQALAEAVAASMLARDAATLALGIRLVSVAPGAASLQMTVRDDMLNAHATCHGGMIAALADSAFAFACNAGNELTVAAGFSVDFIAPGHVGDVLTAEARTVATAGRSGVYDVLVRNQLGATVAVFRGRSHRRPGHPVLPAEPADPAPSEEPAS